MINGSDLRDFYIDCWQNVPELVAAMKDEDEGLIRASQGVAAKEKSLQREIMAMIEGSILVAYQGIKPGRTSKGEVDVHEIAAFVRALNATDDAHYAFAPLMLSSIPTGGTATIEQPEVKIRYLVPHIDANPMNQPRFERVTSSELTFDVWKLSFGIVENFE